LGLQENFFALNSDVTRLEEGLKLTNKKLHSIEDAVIEIKVLRDTMETMEKIGGDSTAEIQYKMI
jgi:hypothetical protein